jgi:ADP-ribose pyrophosphatase YjhB (NUDIX family)
MSDITFLLHGHTINLRVGAVVRRGAEIVICRNRTDNWWYLPGGRLKAGESSVDGLNRELKEELGSTFEIRRPIVCGENFFTFQDAQFHEVCFYYEVSWTGGPLRPDGPETYEEFRWIPVRDVAALELRPAFMKPYVTNPPAALQLVINRDLGSNAAQA